MSKTINAGRVTFVPKDNFSNNIRYKKFDIVTYNGSSYFAKKDTIGHTPTEEEFWQLVAEKGQNGEPGAVKMQVVDTLPETGETDTIYLVKKDNPGEQNLYDEYVYTDTGWEHIGDTSVDLSNYYTKEESDEKLLAKQDKLLAGENITISEDNVISASGGDNNDVSIYTWIYNNFPGSTNTNLKNAYGTFFQDIINDAYTKGKKGIIVIKTSTSVSGLNLDYQYALTASNCNLQLQPTVIAFFGAPAAMDTNIYRRMYFQWARVRAIGTWDNGVFTLDSLYWDGIKNISFLPTNNMWSYTPTGDYNPATKKYVDDQVGNINTILATLTTVSEVTK